MGDFWGQKTRNRDDCNDPETKKKIACETHKIRINAQISRLNPNFVVKNVKNVFCVFNPPPRHSSVWTLPENELKPIRLPRAPNGAR